MRKRRRRIADNHKGVVLVLELDPIDREDSAPAQGYRRLRIVRRNYHRRSVPHFATAGDWQPIGRVNEFGIHRLILAATRLEEGIHGSQLSGDAGLSLNGLLAAPALTLLFTYATASRPALSISSPVAMPFMNSPLRSLRKQ